MNQLSLISGHDTSCIVWGVIFNGSANGTNILLSFWFEKQLYYICQLITDSYYSTDVYHFPKIKTIAFDFSTPKSHPSTKPKY